MLYRDNVMNNWNVEVISLKKQKISSLPGSGLLGGLGELGGVGRRTGLGLEPL